jgi:hypothetical protein
VKAVQNDGSALEYSDESLERDTEILFEAYKNR